MNLTFRVRFATQTSQSLWLTGGKPLPDRLPLQFLDLESWQIKIPLPGGAENTPLNYSYTLHDSGGAQTTDWGRDRVLVPGGFDCEELLVIDSWNDAGFFENAFYTAPFKKVLLAENFTEIKTVAPPNPTHTFRVKSPLLAQGQTVCLLGEGATLGHWNTQSPILLGRRPDEDYFSVQLDLRGQTFPFAYKYGIFDVAKKTFVRYEDGANRILKDEIAPGKHTVVHDGFMVLPPQYWRGAGVAIPVFSLRSENGFGVGEFADLKLLADWGKKAGLKLIQLLPVNDTSATHSWQDSYPYAAISAFALHPIYLNLTAAANASNQKLLQTLEPERQRLNALETVDYEAVMSAKLGFLKTIFPSQKAATFRTRGYKDFFAENQHWLVPYATFCFLRDRFGTPDFSRWPEHKKFDAEKVAALVKGNDEIAFHFFVQYHLHFQLKGAAAQVHSAGLVLKGDIAIGVNRHGADAWQQPELFHMDMQAGAPPDAFAAKGQNWGFPTYNWPRMAADGFAWWKQRFAQMGNYFDAFRIDHILGFFRIWSSPAHAVEGILGHFVPAIPVDPAEFAARGIAFDCDRFTKPFITDAVLREIFGDESEAVRRKFLTADAGGYYSLRPEFATQRQVENYFAKLEPAERDANIKIGLFDLISNVILLEAEGKFHFRFAMEQTWSFKYLPPDTQAKLRDLYVDYFFRRQDDFWKREAMQKLPALKRVTNMLICGEDLGLVPACVPGVMKQLGLLSLEIQRMPKDLHQEFSHPAEAPYLSVVTPSTHDMSTIRGWWREDRALTQKFFSRELGLPGEAPPECEPQMVEAVVRQHLASPAMWSIFQLQDWLGMDGELRRTDVAAERINVPAIPNHYWRYRLHLTLEQLQQEEKFNSHLAQLLRESGRCVSK
ncbi:MAG TPA: 4-alpha-glucanotransferase [Verrucomicrobiae bacterium]|nr:4-alpha-glucanotransferase [Verrucomicrobiae bacterium]